MGYYYSDEYLEHHGILGQKWGVRRFQRKDGTRTAAGKARQNENKKSGLTDQQKKYLKIGAGIVAGCVVAYAGYKITTSPKARAAMNRVLNGSKEKRMAEISKAIDDMGPEIVRKSDLIGDAPKLGLDGIRDLSASETPKNVSEAFGNLDGNPLAHAHPNDCTNVFLAFEGRSRGKDVKPGWQEDGKGLPYHEVTACFKEKTDNMGNSCFKERRNVDSLEKAVSILSRYPDGSRGYASANVTLQGKKFNHAISWTKENGKVSFGDGINGLNAGKILDSIDSSEPFKYFRSDDLEFEEDNYMKHVKS